VKIEKVIIRILKTLEVIICVVVKGRLGNLY